MGRPQMIRKMSDSSLCPDCVQSLIAMRRKRRRQNHTRRLELALNDTDDLNNQESNSNISERSEDERSERSLDSYRSVPSIAGDAIAKMRTDPGRERRVRLLGSQCSLCPHCMRSLNNLNVASKRRHQDKVSSTEHGPRYSYGSAVRRRLNHAVQRLDSPSQCVILKNVDDHVIRQPMENVTKMATLFVNKMALPALRREWNMRVSNANLEVSKQNSGERNANLVFREKNMEDWNRSDDSQEPSLSVHGSFPSLSDEPMVHEAPASSDDTRVRSRKRLSEHGGAGAGGCKRSRRDSTEKDETDEPNGNSTK